MTTESLPAELSWGGITLTIWEAYYTRTLEGVTISVFQTPGKLWAGSLYRVDNTKASVHVTAYYSPQAALEALLTEASAFRRSLAFLP